MSENEITEKIQAIVAGILKADSPSELPTGQDLYRDMGVKSTAALDLLFSLEEEFDVAVPDEEFGDARTIDALTQMIQGLQA